jgi:hypothetical protein
MKDAAQKNSKQLFAISKIHDELDGERQADSQSSRDAMSIMLTETKEVREARNTLWWPGQEVFENDM